MRKKLCHESSKKIYNNKQNIIKRESINMTNNWFHLREIPFNEENVKVMVLDHLPKKQISIYSRMDRNAKTIGKFTILTGFF